MNWQSPISGHRLSVNQVSEFVRHFDPGFSGRLSGHHNYSRVVSLAHFASSIAELGLTEQGHVGVVAGYPDELELKFVRPKRLSFLNWEADRTYDLDEPWFDFPSQDFSLTLCNQALEHVFDPHLAFENLIHQTAPNGLIYVTIPTINCIHGEPNFYSSGYHPRFLKRLAENNKLEVIRLGYWGSYKYLLNAVSGFWLCEKQLLPGPMTGEMLPLMLDVDGREHVDRFITDCWGLFRKPARD